VGYKSEHHSGSTYTYPDHGEMPFRSVHEIISEADVGLISLRPPPSSHPHAQVDEAAGVTRCEVDTFAPELRPLANASGCEPCPAGSSTNGTTGSTACCEWSWLGAVSSAVCQSVCGV
jgi:hypothetical protein